MVKYKYFILNKFIGAAKALISFLVFIFVYLLFVNTGHIPAYMWESYRELMIFFTISAIVVFIREEEYPKFPRRQLKDMMWSTVKDILILFALLSIFMIFTKKGGISRLMLVSVAAGQFISLGIFKVFVDRWVWKRIERGKGRQKIIVVGSGDEAGWFINKTLKNKHWGLDIVGKMIVSGHTNDDKIVPIRDIEELEHILKNTHVDIVIIAVSADRLKSVIPVMTICEAIGIETSLLLDSLFKVRITRPNILSYEYLNFLSFSVIHHDYWALLFKDIMDRILALISLIILSPLLILVAILIKITSPGPVFFVQTRVGKNGKLFKMYKFRSMYKDADKKKRELMHLNEMGKVVFKIKDDPRITPIGKFIRKYSIDELPQLFNILKGEMSFIGPRPPLPEEVAQYEPWQRRRLSMKPGLSCLWQISGRNEIDFDEWMLLDLQYIDNWSLWLDFVIFIKTIIVVITGKGAY